MNADEISLVNPPAQETANSAYFARSDSELCQHQDIANVGEVFNQIGEAHLGSLKTALKSVYPFVPSISNSEYYFIYAPIISLNSQTLGVFALTTKTFSNKLLQDPSQIAAIAYEIEFSLSHRSGFKIHDEFSPLSTVASHGLEALNITSAQSVEHAQFRVSGSSSDVTTAKDMLYAYFQNGFEGQLFSVSRALPLAGAWGYSFKIRGHLIAEGTVYCALGFSLSSVPKLNASLRLNSEELALKLSLTQLRAEALEPSISVALNQFEFSDDLDMRFASGEELPNFEEQESQLNSVQNLEKADNEVNPPEDNQIEEFSYDDTTEPQVAKQNFLTKLFTKEEIPDDIFVIQAHKSNLCRINPGFRQTKESANSAAIVYYTNENIKNKQLTMIGLEFSGGESSIMIGPAFETRIGSKYGSETLKIVMCSQTYDIYIGREFRTSCPAGEIVVKLMEKGSCAEVIEVDM